MDDWVERALARWPNVPALFGWLRLNQRGQWLIRDGVISNQRIIGVINRNYDCDEYGQWFFQNGPQRGYVALDYAPFLLWSQSDGGLATHTGRCVEHIHRVLLDEAGSLVLDTEHGAGLLCDRDLGWALDRLHCGRGELDTAIASALAQPSDQPTELMLAVLGREMPVFRCDAHALPHTLGFVREPAPDAQQGSS